MGAWRSKPEFPLPPSGDFRLSVVIPALDEEANIGNAIRSALDGEPAVSARPSPEIIVVDGGSKDGTPRIAASLGARVVRSPRGRSVQLIEGARAASGDLLLFLHADSRLPMGYRDRVQEALKRRQGGQKGSCWGAFERMQIDGSGRALRFVEWGVRLRTRMLHLPYGDQAIYVTADALNKAGGWKEMPFMEDYELVTRLRRMAAPGLVHSAPIVTSRRRWESLGCFRTTMINQGIILGYHLGVPTTYLKQVYYRCYAFGAAARAAPPPGQAAASLAGQAAAAGIGGIGAAGALGAAAVGTGFETSGALIKEE